MALKLRYAAVAASFGWLLLAAPQAIAATGVSDATSHERTDVSVSAQTRRRPTRLRVTPLPGPVRRVCEPIFRERYIPQWGGWVLNAGQRCEWIRAPR